MKCGPANNGKRMNDEKTEPLTYKGTVVDMSPGGNLTNNGGYRRFPGSTIADFDASDTAYITVTAYNGTKTVDTTYTNDLTFSGYLIAD